MTPPHIHCRVSVLRSAGEFSTNKVECPGFQGAAMAGTHGAGVKTPNLAAVAAATAGIDMVVHCPMVGMLANGLKSMMLAIGLPLLKTVLDGSTTKVAPQGMAKGQLSLAPKVTKVCTGGTGTGGGGGGGGGAGKVLSKFCWLKVISS